LSYTNSLLKSSPSGRHILIYCRCYTCEGQWFISK